MSSKLMNSIKEIEDKKNESSSIKIYQYIFENIFPLYDYMLNDDNNISFSRYLLLFFEYLNLIFCIFHYKVS